MNAKTLIAGLITTIAAAGAFANDDFNGEAYNARPQASASSVSRAQVKADLAQAQAAGQVAYGEAGSKTSYALSTKSRAEVKAEFVRAREAGELGFGEASYKSPYALSSNHGTEVRAQSSKSQSEGS